MCVSVYTYTYIYYIHVYLYCKSLKFGQDEIDDTLEKCSIIETMNHKPVYYVYHFVVQKSPSFHVY